MRKKFLLIGFLGLALGLLGLLFVGPKTALAANPTTINFQGKVVNSDGTNVTDGTYSFVFRIYNTSSPTPTTACGSDSACLFEETQGSVSVTNGTFQVELGSTCSGGLVASNSCTKSAAGGLNFNTNNGLYLTLQFNGDTSGSHGGYMWPVIHLTSAPYAYYADNSGALAGLSAGNFVQLAQGVQTDTSTTNSSIFINKNNSSGTPNILQLQKSGNNVMVLDNNGLLTLQPAASLTAGQSHLSESFTNASSTGGAVQGFSQTVTVSDTASASTTTGVKIALTDATTLANTNSGVSVTVTDNGASGAKTNKAVVGTAGGTNASAVNYGGYFSISGGAAGSTALYATNGTVSANILDLQDGNAGAGGTNISVFTVANSGVVTAQSNSATGFQVQDSSSSKAVFTVDSSTDVVSIGTPNTGGINGKITFNNTGGANTVSIAAQSVNPSSSFTLQLPAALPTASNYCVVSSNLGALSFLPCGAGSTATVTLSPEFFSSVMSGVGGSNIGTMTSDYCAGASKFPSGVNTSVCTVSTDEHNYYSWTANSGNSYDIFVRWSVPQDFASFSSGSFNYWKTAAGDTVTMNVYPGSSTTCATQSASGTSAAWASQSITMTGCSPSAGGVITIDIHLAVGTNGDFARIGEITLGYNRK